MIETKHLALTAAAATLLMILTERVQAVRVGYALGSAREETKKLRDQVAYRRIELDGLRSPQNLSAAADRLGLRPPAPESVVLLDKSSLRADAAAFTDAAKGRFSISRLID